MKIVEELCYAEGGKLIITVDGDNPEDVSNTAAKKAAISYAERYGMFGAGFDQWSGSYPIDEDGNGPESDLYKGDMAKMSKLGKIAGYRNEITLRSRFTG